MQTLIISGEGWASSALGKCSSPELAAYLVSFALILISSRAVYLLYFHPLASFPGPYKAALTSWWQFSLRKGGKTEEIFEQLHKKYDTRALRIGPNELHITDPALYHTIYSKRYIFPKLNSFYDAFNTPHSVFVEVDADLHRERRKLLSNFFSKTSVRSMEGLLLTRVTNMCDRISKMKGNGAVNLYHAFRCLTLDVISEITFGESFNLVAGAEENTFNSPTIECFDVAFAAQWDLIYVPYLGLMVEKCPAIIAAKLSKLVTKFQAFFGSIAQAVVKFRRMKSSGKILDHAVIFDNMQHLDDRLLLAEATDMLVAGADTTATALAMAMEEMIENRAIFEQLKKELKDAGIAKESDFQLVRLEQLPYMTAFVKEVVRWSMPVPGRLPRVVPAGIDPFIVDGQVVPVGTIVGISAHTMHFEESIWGPDARKFNPARWLNDDAKDLEKYLVTFSKGARQCLGVNLAYAEITLTLAMLVQRFRFDLDETLTKSDVNRLDCFLSTFEGTGIRTIVHEDML